MADDTWKAVAAVVVLLIMIVIIYLEFKYLRRKRSAKAGKDTLVDQSYNALITTRAIVSTLERGGVRSEEANELMRKAEEANVKGNRRAVLDFTSQAKDVLMREKLRHKKMGDLAKLPAKSPPVDVEAEGTVKEKLQKELPKNYLQAKFILTDLQKAVDDRRVEGKDVGEATRLLEEARRAFDAKDYDASLKSGMVAKKALEEPGLQAEAAAPPADVATAVDTTYLECKSCGTRLNPDDVFCRKCGVKIEIPVCKSCGTTPRKGDVFCRKCGVSLT